MNDIKLKKCRVCKREFMPFQTTQRDCSWECALALVGKNNEKKARKVLRNKKEALYPLGYWIRQTQVMFNRWIRFRDTGKPCISCGAIEGQMQAGHYRPTSTHPELRFTEDNVHTQCSRCNNFLSGNLIEYRKSLILRVGLDRVCELEGEYEPKQYRKDDVKAIRERYRLKLKNGES